MTGEWQYTEPFLRNLDAGTGAAIEARREAWGLAPAEFFPSLERWICNFDPKDRSLALKLLFKLQYYNETTFKRRIQDLWLPIARYLHESGLSIQNLRLVVPDLRGDSADHHAYNVIKTWGIAQAHIIIVSDLKNADPGSVLVFFNDTHGTGNQFLREVFKEVPRERFAAVFVVAVTIAERALRRFQRELVDVRVLPEQATAGVHDEFTAAEVNRLHDLGKKVYSKHPLGYGDAGLLVAYHFQCPNNTLPLIWADSIKEKNNTIDGKAFPWAPLFVYVPKVKSEPPAGPAVVVEPPDASLLDRAWTWTDEERRQISARIDGWGLSSTNFYRRAGEWFNNFRTEERDIARDVFLATTYLDIGRVRAGIRRLRESLMVDVGRAGGDLADVILVTTGDHKNSVYHYVYEFIREWGLNVDQVFSLGRLGPDRVIDKTLVLFHHTRLTGNHLVANHADRLHQLAPRAVFVACYAMAPAARGALAKVTGGREDRLLCLPEVSKPLSTLVPKHRERIQYLEGALNAEKITIDSQERLLAAYYFQCPDASSPLLWANVAATDGQRGWIPLFDHIESPV